MAPQQVIPAASVRFGSRPSRAYVTFLAGDGDCVGVVGLAKGLKKVKTVYPFVVSIYSCGFVTNCPREDCKSHICELVYP